MKILVVDDHALVREGLRQVLRGIDDQVEVLEAPHCAGAFQLAALHPDLDLVLLDFHLPGMNGLEALQVFAKDHPELPVLVLSGSLEAPTIRQVLAAGAAGFVTKAALSDEFLTAVHMVLAGNVYVPPDLRLMPELPESGTGLTPPQLTPRQEAVLELLLCGRSNRDISQALQLSDETTKNHVSAILRGFGVQTRVQAVLAAGRMGYTKTTP